MHRYSIQSARERFALARLRQILNEPGLLRASWIKMKHPCGRSYCRCAKAKQHWHLSWYVSQSKNGKQRMKSVAQHRLKKVRQWVKRYHQARFLLTAVGDMYWNQIGSKAKS